MEQKVVQKAPDQAKKPTPNMTGIPTQMKLDFERRSGLSFDDVRVHYNSDKPAKIGALAYTRAPQVFIAPRQELQLKHELGHVVQQKQGLVQPTKYIKGAAINDSTDMEKRANHIFSQPISHRAKTYSSQQSIIQCAIPQYSGLSVGASLIPTDKKDVKYSPDQLTVNSIYLSGRTSTGLHKKADQAGSSQSDSKNSSTQGDHTISDAFIKYHQKVMTTGKQLSESIDFYSSLALELESSNKVVSDNMTLINGAIAQVQDASQQLYLKQVFNSDRLEESNVAVSTVRGITNHARISSESISSWITILKDIIGVYNYAYSNSVGASYGKGSGGNAEGSIMESLDAILLYLSNREENNTLHDPQEAEILGKAKKEASLAGLLDSSSWVEIVKIFPMFQLINIQNIDELMDYIGSKYTKRKPVSASDMDSTLHDYIAALPRLRTVGQNSTTVAPDFISARFLKYLSDIFAPENRQKYYQHRFSEGTARTALDQKITNPAASTAAPPTTTTRGPFPTVTPFSVVSLPTSVPAVVGPTTTTTGPLPSTHSTAGLPVTPQTFAVQIPSIRKTLTQRPPDFGKSMKVVKRFRTEKIENFESLADRKAKRSKI